MTADHSMKYNVSPWCVFEIGVQSMPVSFPAVYWSSGSVSESRWKHVLFVATRIFQHLRPSSFAGLLATTTRFPGFCQIIRMSVIRLAASSNLRRQGSRQHLRFDQ